MDLTAGINDLLAQNGVATLPAAQPLLMVNNMNMYNFCKCTVSILFTCCGEKLWDPSTYADGLAETKIVKDGDANLCGITENTIYDEEPQSALCPAGCSACCACTCEDAIKNFVRWITGTFTAFKDWVVTQIEKLPKIIRDLIKDKLLTAAQGGFDTFGAEQTMLLQKTHLLESNTTLRAAKNHDEDLISLVQGGTKSAAKVGWDCG